jgi:hypothetical protein
MGSMSTSTHTDRVIPTGSVNDFDFLVGSWEVASRRLRERGVGSDDWDEFAGRAEIVQRLGGVVNVDQVDFVSRGFSGLTIRSFDQQQRRWSIYWINSGRGVMEPPVVGGFDGDRGLFFGDDVHNGCPVHVIFEWTRLGPDRARWQQSFSADGEALETNWVMEFTRAGGGTVSGCPNS